MDRECKKCIDFCETCDIWNGCSACKSGFFLTEKDCIKECPLEYYIFANTSC